MIADLHAVVTGDTAGKVDGLFAQIDAMGFAGAEAIGAFGASGGIDTDAEGGVFGEPAEESTDGADGVAE